METFNIILTTMACTFGVAVAIWTILDTRKRYPKKPEDISNVSTVLAIRLPEAIEIRLENLAKRAGRSKTSHAREAILAYLDDLEDLHLAEKVAQRIARGAESTSSLADVEARLDHLHEQKVSRKPKSQSNP